MAKPRQVDPAVRDWVRERVAATSIRRVGRVLGIADATVTRIVADLPLQEGTALLAETKARSPGEAA